MTAQQSQTYQGATSAQLQATQTALQPTLTRLKSQIASYQPPAMPSWQSLINGTAVAPTQQSPISVVNSKMSFTDSSGNAYIYTPSVAGWGSSNSASPQTSQALGPLLPPPCCKPIFGPVGPISLSPPDSDGDGLPDTLESGVATSFMPIYGVSAGEQDQFATFGDYVPWTVTSLIGSVPPDVSYRVQPLGLATDRNGAQVYALRIDYLTLWNADGGLIGGGGTCAYSYVGLDAAIQQLTGHALDAERSVMYLTAPAVNGGYNPDPNAYSLSIVYVAAHEGTFFDQSTYAGFFPAVPANNHLNLALSKSKHSTYNFNPDYYPITPQWFIAGYFAGVDAAYEAGFLDDVGYAIATGLGVDTFYGCVVERFSNQGLQFPNLQTNVGEPNHPVNGSGFIDDDSARALRLKSKLVNPVF